MTTSRTHATGGHRPLRAAGALTLAVAVPALAYGAWVTEAGATGGGELSGLVALIGLVVVISAGAATAAGVGALWARRWARVALIVVHALLALGWLWLYVATALEEPEGAGTAWLVWTAAFVAWSTVALTLAAVGRSRRASEPNAGRRRRIS